MRSQLIIISVCLTLAAQSFANKHSVYSWVDDKGVTHFGQRPPQDSDAVLVQKARYQDPEDETATEPNEAIGAVWSDDEQEKLQRERQAKIQAAEVARLDLERCNAAIKNLEALTSQRQVRTMTEEGGSRLLEPHEREAKIKEMNQAIEESCKNQM